MTFKVRTSFAIILAMSVTALPTAASGALLVHYPFDGGSNDATGNAGEAVLNNGAVINSAGRFGGALDLTAGNAGGAAAGSSSNAIVAGGTHLDSAFANNAISVSFHQLNNNVQNSSAFWLHSVAAGAGDRGVQAHTPWSNGTIYFDQSGCCASPTQRLTGQGIVPGVWQHFVFQRDAGGNMEIWVDGALSASSPGAEPLDAFEGIITLGSEGVTNNNGFDGLIDDFAVFDRMLTPSEIQQFSTNPIAINPVPEPSGALFGILGSGILFLRRRL